MKPRDHPPNVANGTAPGLTHFVVNQLTHRWLTEWDRAAIETHGGGLIDSRASYEALKSATRRTMLLLFVALSIAVNAATGAFAGVVHAHDHEHGEHHAHEHDDDHKHQDDHGDDKTTLANAGSGDGNNPRGHHDTLHEHGAMVVLALVQVGSPAPVDIGSSPGILPDRGTISDVRHQLERPPRRV